ncbi:MAG: cation:proton antiporter subunit C [Cellulomonadaceae bacterium]|jgi:multicomponent Na+:H+ antiporter subunit C|nr:cation:proton antiporter subunit C [Cellulomonadaceae bacterium]
MGMREWLNGPNVAVVLFFIGIAGLTIRKNMMMSVICLGVLNAAAIVFFVTMNSSPTYAPPMMADGTLTESGSVADPVPQALMITSVVIGVAVTAMMLVLILGIYRQHGTIDWAQAKLIREGRGTEIADAGFAAPAVNWRSLALGSRKNHPPHTTDGRNEAKRPPAQRS